MVPLYMTVVLAISTFSFGGTLMVLAHVLFDRELDPYLYSKSDVAVVSISFLISTVSMAVIITRIASTI